MKTKAIAAFLCLLLTLPLLEGCGKSAPAQPEPISVEDVPAEVRQKLQAAREAEPITIPAEEWTVDTLCQAIYINGEQLTLPYTLNDLLGEGFEIREDDDHQIRYIETKKRATGFLTYYGRSIGIFYVDNCESIEDVFDAPLLLLSLSFDYDEPEECSPISINGVALDSTIQLSKDRLYFMDVNSQNEERGALQLKKTIGSFSITCTHGDNKLKTISIYFNIDKEF